MNFSSIIIYFLIAFLAPKNEMIEKIIDFVALPFVFVTDFIERCRCKYRYKIL